MSGVVWSTMPAAELTAIPESKFAPVALRYGVSAVGPLSISAAHFAAALLFLHSFGRAEFGLFSFLLVVVPFCLSLSGALIGAPVAIAVQRGAMHAHDRGTYLKANLLVGALAAVSTFVLMIVSGAGSALATILGAYGSAMTLRALARTSFYAQGAVLRVPVSDVLYSVLILTGLFVLHAFHLLNAMAAAEVLLFAACAGLVSFGRNYLAQQFVPAGPGSLRDYGRIWLELARWSALGVVLTELTVNAHAYLVTFICGPAAFAPIAAGALFIRPVQLVLSAIPDRERPVMARQLGRRDFRAARQTVNQFRMAAGAVWLATVTPSVMLLLWIPGFVLRKGYDPSQALVVLAFFAAITAVRALRIPESVFLQAAGRFRTLANASLWSSIVSLIATLVLLLVFGPVFPLAGILAGELVVATRVIGLSRRWRADHV